MEVLLAGYNVDGDLLAQLRRSIAAGAQPSDASARPHEPHQTGAKSQAESQIDPEALTPETLSAAYARISRDPRPIPELRADARQDVARARHSNRRIVFGFGHASVAEHAVFNFDVLGLSRLAVEALEATRLGSYTEKSQRYIRISRDAIIPAEIAGGPLEKDFAHLLDGQQRGYERACAVINDHYRTTRPADWADRRSRALLEGAAQEDARYFLGLATAGQLGATLNARSLEATVGRLGAHPLAEVRELAGRLHAAVADIAPSLVLHTEPPAYRCETPHELAKWLNSIRDAARLHVESTRGTGALHAASDSSLVTLIDFPASEDALLAAIVHGHAAISWAQAQALVQKFSAQERRDLMHAALHHLSAHDAPLRQFELPACTFELVVSASCFAQLKRHRMATLLTQDYDPRLGVTIPAIFAEAGLTSEFDSVRRASEELHARISERSSTAAAAYALTNAHRRRLLFRADARELYHLARLRMDAHAQWDIRALVTEMIRQARERMPLAMMLAGGKDRFEEIR